MQSFFQKIIPIREKINDFFERPIYVYTFGLFFLINRTSQYFPSFELSIFILCLLFYTVLSYLLLNILKKTFFAKIKSLIVLCLWICLLFIDVFRDMNYVKQVLLLFVTCLLIFLIKSIKVLFWKRGRKKNKGYLY